MKIYHLSSSRRFKKDGTPNNGSGVEKFGWYLHQVTGCEIVTPEDNIKPEIGDTIIGDGYYVGGFDPDKFRLISIVHGSWKEFAIRNKKESDFFGEADRQHKIWTNPKIQKVAVSEASAYYLKKHHGVEADAIILNGVDTELFKPVNHKNDKYVVIYAANDYNKNGQGRLGKIADILRDVYEFRYLDAKIGEEHIKFAQGDIYIQGSFYEGNSYGALEAMSCNLPIIASRAGLFEITDFKPYYIGGIVDWDAPAEEFAEMIKLVMYSHTHNSYNPREWVLHNASFEIFKDKWRNYLGI